MTPGLVAASVWADGFVWGSAVTAVLWLLVVVGQIVFGRMRSIIAEGDDE